MEIRRILVWIRQLIKAVTFIVIFAVVIPAILAALLDIPIGVLLGFILSIIILQAAAATVGAGLFDIPFVLAVMLLFAFGFILGIFEICDTLSNQSERVKNWLNRIEEKTKKMTILQKYGVSSLTVIAWIPGIGLYGSPVIAWLIGWDRKRSVVFILLGWFIASLAVLLFARGIIQIVF